jgi:hypothetical protein
MGEVPQRHDGQRPGGDKDDPGNHDEDGHPASVTAACLLRRTWRP